MTISVLASVYKNEQPEYLERCLKSVWDDQTLKPNQIILIQDGPVPDDLNDVIKKWSTRLGSVLVLHINEQNLGLTKSLNIGIGYVTSDLIARIDTDDFCEPRRFELQEKFLSEHQDIFVVGGTVRVVDKEGNFKYLKHFKNHHQQLVSQICWKCPLPHPAVMMRTFPFKELGLKYNEDFRNSQDIALWFDSLRLGLKMANMDDILINFTEDNDVYQRRGKVRALNEYKSFSNGTKELFGVWSPKRLLPILRYAFRLAPVGIIKMVYNSKTFEKIFK